MNKDHGIHEEANRTTTSYAGLTPNGLPKVQEETHVFVKNSYTGVSTNCVLKKSDLYARQHKLPPPETGLRLEWPTDANVAPTTI